MKERHPGIDLLRILSMFLVLILHILGQGGILDGMNPSSISFKAAWFLEIAAYCSVNCYALVTGYVSIDSKFKYSRIIALWFQVVFYTLLITVGFRLIRPEVLWPGLFSSALMPVTHNQYWYFTAYFGMFFFIPYINKLLLSLDKAKFKALVFALIALFSILPTVFRVDLFKTSSGYSMVWLVVLYIIGAYIKLYGFGKDRGKLFYFSAFLLFIILTWCSKFLGVGLKYNNNIFIGYTSPFIVGSAISLLMLCSKLEVVSKVPKYLISRFTAASFGVYLIHTNPIIWQVILSGKFAGYAPYGVPKLLASVLVTAFVIYFACSLIDIVRIEIFKLIRIKQLSDKIESGISFLLKKYLLKDENSSRKSRP